MSPGLKAGISGALIGLVIAVALTLVPSDHPHTLDDLWTDHLWLTLLLVVGCGLSGAWGARRKGDRS